MQTQDDLIVHSLHSSQPGFSAGFEGEGKGRRLTGAEVFLNFSARKEAFSMWGKSHKKCTDLLGAERQHLKASCIVIQLSCEDVILATLETRPCARAEMFSVLLGQETPGFLRLGSCQHEAAFHLTAGAFQELLREILEPQAEELLSWVS